MAAARFDVVVGTNNLIQFKLVDSEGKDVVVSRGYPNKDDAFAGIRAVKENAAYQERYERRGEDGKFSFRLKSASHQVVGEGGPYAKEEEREAAIAVVRRAGEAAVMDRTGT